jgi:hypothetical protein
MVWIKGRFLTFKALRNKLLGGVIQCLISTDSPATSTNAKYPETYHHGARHYIPYISEDSSSLKRVKTSSLPSDHGNHQAHTFGMQYPTRLINKMVEIV